MNNYIKLTDGSVVSEGGKLGCNDVITRLNHVGEFRGTFKFFDQVVGLLDKNLARYVTIPKIDSINDGSTWIKSPERISALLTEDDGLYVLLLDKKKPVHWPRRD